MPTVTNKTGRHQPGNSRANILYNEREMPNAAILSIAGEQNL
jgi:hypothetical protein